MVCAIATVLDEYQLIGEAKSPIARLARATPDDGALGATDPPVAWDVHCEATEDPFDDFEEDDFDDDFDDDFEEDWEDDLTEDEEFPDTFGGEEPEEEPAEGDEEESPFADDPDFDD